MQKLGIPLTLLLIIIAAIGPLSLNGVLPATSVVMTELSGRYEVAQLILTLYLLANLLSQLIMGPIADQHGRRPVMLISLMVFIAGSLVCAFAPSMSVLLIGRFIQGLGAAVCVFLPRAIVRDIYSDGRAASMIGYMTTAMMVAPMFGPATGGWITDEFSWRYLYVGLAGLGLVILFLTWRFQVETLATKQAGAIVDQSRPRHSMRKGSAILLRNPAFLACACMQAGSIGVYYVYLAGAPYVAMESRGLTASAYGRWFAMVAIGYISGNLIAGKFSERMGVQNMILLGYIPFLFGILSFWILLPWDHPAALFLPMLFVAHSNGIALPSMFTQAMSIRPELTASASGLAGSAQMGFGILLSIIAGFVLPYGDYWLFVLISASTVVSLIGLWLTRRFSSSA